MKKLFFTLSLLCAGALAGAAQNGAKVPRLTKTPIGNTGCAIYLPATATPEISYSPDSSVVYTIEVPDSTTGSLYHFGCIMVSLNNVDLAGMEEDMLVSYMDYLKEAFKIEKWAGYGKGHTLPSHPSAKGIIDYWQDESGDQWAVKGWAAESTIFIMFIYGQKEYPVFNIQDMFLNGARFKGD